jgi:hypothetical protein
MEAPWDARIDECRGPTMLIAQMRRGPDDASQDFGVIRARPHETERLLECHELARRQSGNPRDALEQFRLPSRGAGAKRPGKTKECLNRTLVAH